MNSPALTDLSSSHGSCPSPTSPHLHADHTATSTVQFRNQQISRKRTRGDLKVTFTTSFPHNDSYLYWRKYGEKKINGFDHGRSYYKCGFEGCKAKKRVQMINPTQVQKQNLDYQPTFNVTYEGAHLCGTRSNDTSQKMLVLYPTPTSSSSTIMLRFDRSKASSSYRDDQTTSVSFDQDHTIFSFSDQMSTTTSSGDHLNPAVDHSLMQANIFSTKSSTDQADDDHESMTVDHSLIISSLEDELMIDDISHHEQILIDTCNNNNLSKMSRIEDSWQNMFDIAKDDEETRRFLQIKKDAGFESIASTANLQREKLQNNRQTDPATGTAKAGDHAETSYAASTTFTSLYYVENIFEGLPDI